MTINDEKVTEIYKEFGDSDIKIENIEECQAPAQE